MKSFKRGAELASQDSIDHDLLLIKPESAAFSSFPPLNLMILAASTKQRGYTVGVLDLCYEEDRADLENLDRRRLPLLIGLTATTPEFNSASRVVRQLKSWFPELPIVIGGVHISALGAEALLDSGADFGVVGEGEEALCLLLEGIAEKLSESYFESIPGLLIRRGEGILTVPPAQKFADVDSLPFADWDCLRSERYFSRSWGILQERDRTGFIVTSRGCPYSCSFCSSGCTSGKVFRGRSPSLVVDEIEILYRRFGIREFLIADDNFTLDRERVVSICEEILRRGLDISWRTPNGVRVDSIDLELVRIMRKSGCYLIGFGIESADRSVMARTNKSIMLNQVVDNVAMCRSEGFMTFGTFILGLPGETIKSAQATISFAVKSGIDIAHFGTYLPFPGSPDFDEMKDLPGMRDWDRYVLFEPLPCSDLTPSEMKTLMRKAYVKFYFRPARARLYLKMLKPAQMVWALRAFRTYLS